MNDFKFIIGLIIFLYGINLITNRKSKKIYDKKQQYLDKKGREGEEYVFYELKKYVYDGELYSNVFVPINYNKQTEIDILLVNGYGIFVIESKNWDGTVKGSENDDDWILFSKNSTNEVRNPCKQNEYHLKKLREYLKINDDVYYSIVVFGYDTKLDFSYENSSTSVMGIRELEDFMESVSRKEKVLSEEKIKYIHNKIQGCINKDYEFKQRHIERVKNLKRRSD